MKICIDCKHHLPEGSKCLKSKDMVTGVTFDAALSRNTRHLCGVEAKWFEPAVEDWKEPRDKDGYRTGE